MEGTTIMALKPKFLKEGGRCIAYCSPDDIDVINANIPRNAYESQIFLSTQAEAALEYSGANKIENIADLKVEKTYTVEITFVLKCNSNPITVTYSKKENPLETIEEHLEKVKSEIAEKVYACGGVLNYDNWIILAREVAAFNISYM